MERKTRQQLVDEIEELCDKHGCSEKIAKIHHAQYVDRRWHPHPPADFVLWFASHPDSQFGVKTKVAWNYQTYREQFRTEQTQYGL